MNSKKWFKFSIFVLIVVFVGCALWLYYSLSYNQKVLNDMVGAQVQQEVEEVEENPVEEQVDKSVVSEDNGGSLVESDEPEYYVEYPNGEVYTDKEAQAFESERLDPNGDGYISDEELQDYAENPVQPDDYLVYVNLNTQHWNNDSLPIPYHEGMTAFDVLDMLCDNAGIPYEFTNTLGSVYVTSIDGLAERDYGPMSGWLYEVNGVQPDVSASQYELSDGDSVVWIYNYDQD